MGLRMTMCDNRLHPRDGCDHGACMAYFTKRYHPPGTPPGTLIEHPAPQAGPLRLHLIDYTAEGVSEQDDVTLTQCKVSLERDAITWIHARGNLATEQVSLFMGERYLISFHQGQGDPFEPVRKRLTAAAGKMRARGADYLLYSLVDLIIDEGFPVLVDMGERIERLEEELLDQPNKRVLGEIHILKRDLLLLRRMLWPQREVLTQLMREDQTLIHEETKPYLRDCYDHTVQIMDLFETYRDMAASMLDVYLSSASQRLNEIMRVLTVITTLFIPPTFLVGVYGMNFDNPRSPWAMPELHSYYGYPIVWLVIIAMIAGRLVFFKRRGWF